jgi:RecA-family ATPase
VSNREDPIPQVIIPRLNALNANLNWVHFWNPYLPRDTDELEEKIKQLRIKCVIMDPASAHLGASIYNDQDVRTCLGPLSEVCWRTGCAVIFIHHTIKSTSDGIALRSIGGSGGGLPGAARAAFIFGMSPDDEDERVLAPAKFNLGPKPASVLFEMDEYEWAIEDSKGNVKLITAGKLLHKSSNSKISAEKVLMTSSGQTSIKTVDKKAEAAEWVTNYLSYGTRKQTELSEDSMQYGISFRTLRRAAEDIGIIKERRGFGKDGYWMWSLPQGHPSLIPTCCDKPEIVTDSNLQQRCASCGHAYGLTSPGDQNAEA